MPSKFVQAIDLNSHLSPGALVAVSVVTAVLGAGVAFVFRKKLGFNPKLFVGAVIVVAVGLIAGVILYINGK